MKYAILLNPGHNRVYFDQSAVLAAAELAIVPGLNNIQEQNIAGTPYITFETERVIRPAEAAVIWRASSCYCLFALEGRDEKILLAPEERPSAGLFDLSVGSMLKYPGKTNELFTRLMINLAEWSTDFAGQDRLSLLDPVAGKGTTLLEGLALGHDVAGIEISERPAREFCVFFKKYLEMGKYKHTYKQERHGGKPAAHTVDSFEMAGSKGDLRSGEGARRLTMITGDSAHADKYLKKGWAHIIVGDLAYGVAHGNVIGGNMTGGQKGKSPSRNPYDMLAVCLPAWAGVLKKGGALALSWNTFLLSRGEMVKLLGGAGLAALDGGPYLRFEHRVDQAIRRDVVVAKKI